MISDSARHLPARTPGVMARIAGQVRQFICALHGHDSLMHFDEGRVSLLCSSCGYETPGWDVKTTTVRQPADAGAKPRVVRMRFATRRVA